MKDTETQFCWIYCFKFVTCFLHYPTLKWACPRKWAQFELNKYSKQLTFVLKLQRVSTFLHCLTTMLHAIHNCLKLIIAIRFKEMTQRHSFVGFIV